MAKKNFKSGLESLLTNSTQMAPQSTSKVDVEKPSEIRATFIIREDYLEKIKAISYWDRLLVKDVMHQAIGQYLEKYGNVKSIPEKKIN